MCIFLFNIPGHVPDGREPLYVTASPACVNICYWSPSMEKPCSIQVFLETFQTKHINYHLFIMPLCVDSRVFFLYIGFILTLLHKGLMFRNLFRIDFHFKYSCYIFHLSPDLPKHQILWTDITRLMTTKCYYRLKSIQSMVVHNVVSNGFISNEDELKF